MEHDMIKSAAACLADTALSAREKQAQGIWESAKQDPLKYSLMGAGLGATAGGVGGGLLSWLRRRPDEDEGKRRRDILAGALIGGGLGAGAGAAPGLVGAIQKGTKPPEYEVERPKGVSEAAVEDLGNLLDWKTTAGAGAGAVAGAGILSKIMRHVSLQDIARMPEEEASRILQQLGLLNVPANRANTTLSNIVRNTSLRKTMMGTGRTVAQDLAKGRIRPALSSLRRGVGGYGTGMLAAKKALRKIPLSGKAGAAGIAGLALLAALGAKKTIP